MASPTTVNRVKADLRIRHTALDSDISDMVDACLADLRSCGVREPVEGDPLILNAVKLWCRASYEDDTDRAAAYMTRYNSFKGTLMVAAGYGGDPS